MSGTGTRAWAAAYAGLDDAALVALGNAGLLRRARKDEVAVAEEDTKGATLSVGAFRVRLDRRGPAAVACDCPTAGVCQHVVAACLWAREVAPAVPEGEAAGAGVTAQAAPAPRAVSARTLAARAAAQEAAVRRREDTLAEVRSAVAQLVETGLSHLGRDDADELRAVAGRSRLAGLERVHGVRLDALVRTAAGLVEDLVTRDDSVDESDVLDALAEVWALCEVLATPSTAGAPGSPPSAPGGDETGKDHDEADLERFLPLGVRWWTAPSGSRGLSYVGWDPAEGRVRTVVTGRASGTDPSFQRSWDTPVLWGASLERLTAGPVALRDVRLRPDGALGAGGSPRLTALGGFEPDELVDVATRTGAGTAARDVVGFGRRPAQVRLVMVRDAGEVGVDEVRQDLTWRVTGSDGAAVLLRLPAADERACETLLSVVAAGHPLVAVTVERHDGRDEPVGLFTRDTSGRIVLVSPTVTPAWRLETGARWWVGWRRRVARLRALRSKAAVVAPSGPPPAPAERACLLLGEVLTAVAATGRSRLSARQRSDAEQARTLARDLGLVTLERTAADLVDGAEALDPGSVLRTAFVVGRARAVVQVQAG